MTRKKQRFVPFWGNKEESWTAKSIFDPFLGATFLGPSVLQNWGKGNFLQKCGQSPSQTPYIYKPHTSLGGPCFWLENVKKQREMRKTKAETGKDEKEKETLKHEYPEPFRWGCFMAIFDYKTGDCLRCLTQTCPPTEVHSHNKRQKNTYTACCLRLKPFHPQGFQLSALIFILSAGFITFISKNRTFLRATHLIPQFRGYRGLQREIVRATLEKIANFQGLYSVLIITFLLTLSLPYGKPFLVGIRAKEEGEAEKREEAESKGQYDEEVEEDTSIIIVVFWVGTKAIAHGLYTFLHKAFFLASIVVQFLLSSGFSSPISP